jgi:hypothetical protein
MVLKVIRPLDGSLYWPENPRRFPHRQKISDLRGSVAEDRVQSESLSACKFPFRGENTRNSASPNEPDPPLNKTLAVVGVYFSEIEQGIR